MNENDRMSTFTIASSSTTDSNYLLREESSLNQPPCKISTRRKYDCILMNNYDHLRTGPEHSKNVPTSLGSKYFKSEVFQKIFLVGSNVQITKSGTKTSGAASEALQSLEDDDDDEYQTIRQCKKITRKNRFLSSIMRRSKKGNNAFKNVEVNLTNENHKSQPPSKRGINRIGGHLVGARLAPNPFDQSTNSVAKGIDNDRSIRSNLCTVSSESESTINIYHEELSEFSIRTPKTSTLSIFDDDDDDNSLSSYHSYFDDSKNSMQTSSTEIPKPRQHRIQFSPKSILGKHEIEEDEIEPDLFQSSSEIKIDNDTQESDSSVHMVPTTILKSDSRSVSSQSGNKSRSLGFHRADSAMSTDSSTGSFRKSSSDNNDLINRIKEESTNAVRFFQEKKYDQAKSRFETILRNNLKITGPYSLEVATIHEYIGECIYKKHFDDIDEIDENTINLTSIQEMILHYLAALKALHVKLYDNESVIKVGDLLVKNQKNAEGKEGENVSPESTLIQLLKTKDGDSSSQEKLTPSERPQVEERLITRVDKRLTTILFL